MTSVNIIGAGNLGQTIGKLLSKLPKIKITAICNQSKESAEAAIAVIGQGKYINSIKNLPPVDITFITVPDDAIGNIAAELAQSSKLKSGSIVVHCSGALSSKVLAAVKTKNCLIASLHPLRSFAHPVTSIDKFSGTFCGMEGDGVALKILEEIFTNIGGKTFLIDKNKKDLYHAASVFASNYVITLAHEALQGLTVAGIKKNQAVQIIASLMQGAITNLEETLSPAAALTGPIKRGDLKTIKKHIQALNPQQRNLYCHLALATIDISNLKKEVKECIKNALEMEL